MKDLHIILVPFLWNKLSKNIQGSENVYMCLKNMLRDCISVIMKSTYKIMEYYRIVKVVKTHAIKLNVVHIMYKIVFII